jgi:hypothetical protein
VPSYGDTIPPQRNQHLLEVQAVLLRPRYVQVQHGGGIVRPPGVCQAPFRGLRRARRLRRLNEEASHLDASEQQIPASGCMVPGQLLEALGQPVGMPAGVHQLLKDGRVNGLGKVQVEASLDGPLLVDEPAPPRYRDKGRIGGKGGLCKVCATW